MSQQVDGHKIKKFEYTAIMASYQMLNELNKKFPTYEDAIKNIGLKFDYTHERDLPEAMAHGLYQYIEREMGHDISGYASRSDLNDLVGWYNEIRALLNDKPDEFSRDSLNILAQSFYLQPELEVINPDEISFISMTDGVFDQNPGVWLFILMHCSTVPKEHRNNLEDQILEELRQGILNA